MQIYCVKKPVLSLLSGYDSFNRDFKMVSNSVFLILKKLEITSFFQVPALGIFILCISISLINKM